jgi:GNAT superfamily N-acetyltransferase
MQEVRDVAWSAQAHLLRLPDGEPFTVRTIRPQDAARLQAYMRGLSIETRRSRFLGALSELSATELDRLTHMGRPGELALLAFAHAGEMLHTVAEAVMVTATDSRRSEIALSVADAWQGRGLGTLLLRNLECRARMLSARYIFGDVLRTNTAMKCLARKAGFSIRSPFTDARLVEIVKDLSMPPLGLPCREQFALPPPPEHRAGFLGTQRRVWNDLDHIPLTSTHPGTSSPGLSRRPRWWRHGVRHWLETPCPPYRGCRDKPGNDHSMWGKTRTGLQPPCVSAACAYPSALPATSCSRSGSS